MSDVTITNFRPMDKGVMRGFFTVEAAGTKIHDCRLVQPQGKPWFVTGPQTTFTKRDGTNGYKQLVEFGDGFLKRITLAMSQHLKTVVIEAESTQQQMQGVGADDLPF